MQNHWTIIKTEDGSVTLKNSLFDETYHSIHGANSESMHVFVDSGLKYLSKNNVNIFEVGFGSGLNALLTLNFATEHNLKVDYFAIEKYPVSEEIILDYSENFENQTQKQLFLQIHKADWNKKIQILENFFITKINADLLDYQFVTKFDACYFDAFSYDTQPQMWSVDVFEKIYKAMNNGGVLVTYSAKGVVKQNLRQVGFLVKRLKGFKKRHILRAEKA